MFGLTTNKGRGYWHGEAPQARAIGMGGPMIDAVQAEGIVAGTKIHTEYGWRPVEAIQPGDLVTTFDNGARPVVHVKRADLWSGEGACPRHAQPLAVPEGVLGNAMPMMLLPEQSVLIESDLAEEAFGDPFAMIPAVALDGHNGITRIEPMAAVEVLVLEFDEEQVVYANGAGMIHCRSAHHETCGIEVLLDEEAQGYAALPLEAARTIVAALDPCQG